MAYSFEWDAAKAEMNDRKHGVSFSEAASVFGDPLAALFDDPDHSVDEVREVIVGHSDRGRLLIVSFTVRRETIRIISGRSATPRERRDYENRPAGDTGHE